MPPKDINPLNWTLDEIVNEVKYGKISTEQATKMIDRKAKLLEEKVTKCRNRIKPKMIDKLLN